MEISRSHSPYGSPLSTPSTREYPDVRERVALSRSQRAWRDTLRANRLGSASYRDVRAARRSFEKLKRHYDDRQAAERAAHLAEAATFDDALWGD